MFENSGWRNLVSMRAQGHIPAEPLRRSFDFCAAPLGLVSKIKGGFYKQAVPTELRRVTDITVPVVKELRREGLQVAATRDTVRANAESGSGGN
jgi:hypothetical protein